QNTYIAFRLTGARHLRPSGSNRDAVGALVYLHIGKEIMVRQVHAAGGYLSQSSQTLHFGLGDRTKIDRVEIRWPSGVKQMLNDPAINILHPLTEPAGTEGQKPRGPVSTRSGETPQRG